MAVDMLEDVEVKGPGIHYTFFTSWVQLNSWAWILHPWYYNPHDRDMFRYYCQLRYSLIPYIYSAAINSTLTGLPIVRPMPLAYPDEPKLSNSLNQFMFGEYFLVGAYTDSVYLPQGRWIDYWSGKKYTGQQSLKCNVPKYRGGPLFIREGAIIPFQKPMQFIGENPIDTLIIKVYPYKESSYTLLEDDGVSYDFEKGNIAKTLFESKEDDKGVEFIIHPVQGQYTGMLNYRTYQLELFLSQKPAQVFLNGNRIENLESDKDGKLSVLIDQKNISEKQVLKIIN
jgi:alpha-glucosidase (family GH31 glycosyl hydrolase)